MQKVLPFRYPPVVDVYSCYANRVAIVSLYPQWSGWVASRFIRIAYQIKHKFLDFLDRNYTDRFHGKYGEVDATYRYVPCLEEHDITEKLAAGDLVRSVIDYIDNGCYVLLHLDHYFIRGSSRYRKFHFRHDQALVYGYDPETGTFLTGDNFDWGKYITMQVPFKEFEEARRYIEKTNPNYALSCRFLENQSYRFDPDYVVCALNDYALGRDSSADIDKPGFSNEHFIYGLDNYGRMIAEYEKAMSSKENFDYRALHLLANHKAVILLLIDILSRMGKLQQPDKLTACYEELSRYCLAARNHALKYNMTKATGCINKNIDFLACIHNKEKDAVNLLLKSIILDTSTHGEHKKHI